MTGSESVDQLCELQPGQVGDCFVLLGVKDRATTRDGKPYFRCQFGDAQRTVTAMIWVDSAYFSACEQEWNTGDFYRLQGKYTETKYGPQITIDHIRPVDLQTDTQHGFEPSKFYAGSRFDIDEMYAELMGIARDEISEEPLQQLVVAILTECEESVKRMPAATRNHHAFPGGYLEHVLSVTKTALFLADKYASYYSQMQPPLSKSLVVAGAILHDVGKFRELVFQPHHSTYSAEGRLVGHILLGRDLVRDYANNVPELSPDTLLRLEHIIIAHQNLPEWGSPIAPHTPEALLVHYADDIDAKFQMMATSLEEEMVDDAEFTSRHNGLRRPIFRGLNK